ncbi:MAG: NAD(P)-binding domain-containing protein [Betaproteobacteria bacterium]|nr:NAD(P)-binding domain-containing protein [Betaproteobacteria bacterium]
MDKVGFIGYGHMGSVMLKSLLATKAIVPEQVLITTQTKNRLHSLKDSFPGIEIADSNSTVAKNSSMLFLCVGTSQVKSVLSEILGVLSVATHLVIISGGLEIPSVEQLFDGPITKLIPTIISEVHEGVTLICSNAKVSPVESNRIGEMFTRIGKIKVIAEQQFEICADFTSCAPGLLACICEQFVRAGVKQRDIAYDDAVEMFLQTLYGTAKLLLQNGENFGELRNRVATKGGATEGGAAVLEAMLPAVFDIVFSTTLERHEARKQITRQQFGRAANV